MKKHVLQTIYLILFLLICLLPSAGILFFGPSGAAANEVLAQPPALRTRDGQFNKGVLSDISDWTADHFALRQEYVTLWSEINAYLFRTSVEDKVILGSGGWLYYRETMSDYRGIGLEESQLKAAVRNLSLMQEYVTGKGAGFIFTVAPNKNTLYPEHMPDSVPGGHERSNLQRMGPILEQYGIHYADLAEAFSNEEQVLYYKTDSHWNTEGAALAADRILNGLGLESAYFKADFVLGEEHTGDLYEMLYPAGKYREQDRAYSPGFSFTTARDTNKGNAITIEARSADGEGTLLCWRDSFGVSLYPYLAESFTQSRFSRSTSYDLTQIESEEVSAVAIELVERNLDYLLRYMAIYPAPERTTPVYARTAQERLTVRTEKGKTASAADLVELTCTIPESWIDPEMPAYFLSDDTCYEAAMLFPEEGSARISAWVPAGKTQTIALICGQNGVFTLYNAG